MDNIYNPQDHLSTTAIVKGALLPIFAVSLNGLKIQLYQ